MVLQGVHLENLGYIDWDSGCSSILAPANQPQIQANPTQVFKEISHPVDTYPFDHPLINFAWLSLSISRSL